MAADCRAVETTPLCIVANGVAFLKYLRKGGTDDRFVCIFSIIRGGAQKAAKGPSLGILHEFTQYEKDFSGHSPGIRLR
jgi:hypothetical protein